MRHLLLALLIVAGSSLPAWAGCAEYGKDGLADKKPPAATICYKGKCKPTVLFGYCGNVHLQQYNYESGWHFEGDVPSGPGQATTWRAWLNDDEVPIKKVSCKAIDKGACFGDRPSQNVPLPQPKP